MKIKPDIKEVSKIRELLKEEGVSIGFHWVRRVIEEWEENRQMYDYPSDKEIRHLIETLPEFYERFFSCLGQDFREYFVLHILRRWAEMEEL